MGNNLKSLLGKEFFEISKNASGVSKTQKEIPKPVEEAAGGPNLGSLG